MASEMPCPFCGATEELRRFTDGRDEQRNDWSFVRCGRCDAEGPDPDRGFTWESRAEAAQLLARLDAVDTAVRNIEQWADAYPPDIFTEISKEEVRQCVKAMIDHSGVTAPSDRLHASWARHIFSGIRKELADARAALTPAPPAGTDRGGQGRMMGRT